MSVITLIPSYKQMILDGDAVNFDLKLDTNIHAVQWDGSKGHIEYNDGSSNEEITEFDEDGWIVKHKQVVLDEATAAVAAQKKIVDAMTYKEKRKMEYDQLEQFEMQYDDKINNTTTWVDAIKAIKAAYPK
jgi:hypothetical protein